MTSEVGDIVTVILWRGQYRNDGLEVLQRVLSESGDGFDGLASFRLEGDAGRWFVVADAVRYRP